MSKWEQYYRQVGDKPNGLLRVLRDFKIPRGSALDLGAGNMRDTKVILQAGFKNVVAVELDAACRDYLVPGIDLRVCSIEEFEIKQNNYDLIYSCNVLYFLSKSAVQKVFQDVWRGLRPGGIFACTLLGPQDDWAKQDEGRLDAFSRIEIARLAQGFQVPVLRENNGPGKTASGHDKNWHQWTLVFKKLSV